MTRALVLEVAAMCVGGTMVAQQKPTLDQQLRDNQSRLEEIGRAHV